MDKPPRFLPPSRRLQKLRLLSEDEDLKPPEPQAQILPGHEICRSKTTQSTDRQDELPPYLGIRSEPFLKDFKFSMNVNLIDNIFHILPFYDTKWSLLSPRAATVLIPIETSRTQATIKMYTYESTRMYT